ncbi:hypothetical protein AB0H71_16810 [Nocardia sp. NPDC050697]|uniref:hypothetical protein n=1 Tax=Nocardia sp. NPDC050697 TaxID=3155158 RepID=UPI003405AF4E
MTAVMRLVALAAVALAAVTGCAERTTPGQSLPVRHEPEPLTQRFPGLGEPVTTEWVSWDNNSERGAAPGPSTVWIEAVVELRPERAGELRALSMLTGEDPDLRDPLRPLLPDGPFRTGRALDRALTGETASEWWPRAYLEETGNRLVLLAVLPA